MPRKPEDGKHLRHIISFRVSDEELQSLKRLAGQPAVRLSGVLRQLVKKLCEGAPDPACVELLTVRRTCRG